MKSKNSDKDLETQRSAQGQSSSKADLKKPTREDAKDKYGKEKASQKVNKISKESARAIKKTDDYSSSEGD